MNPLGYRAAVNAFRQAYEAGHPDEQTAFEAGLAAAEPYMRVLRLDLKKRAEKP